MTDQTNDVKQEEATITESSTVESQTSSVSEDVNTQDDKYENVRRALQAEREEKKALKEKLRELEDLKTYQPAQQQTQDDDAYKRFLQTEARSIILEKAAIDPSFRERIDLVKKVMEERGVDVETADNMVKAKLFDRLTKEVSSQQREEQPKQIKTQATSEPTATFKPSGDRVKDIMNDPNIHPALREAYRYKLGM